MTRTDRSTSLRTPALAAAGFAIAGGFWSAFLWQQLLVARSGGDPFCALGGEGCSALWDGAFASQVHGLSGLPVAAWGLVWSAAAAILAMITIQRVDKDASPEPAWSGAVLLAAAGILSVVLLGIVSVSSGQLCTNCIITYALVAAYAASVYTGTLSVRPRAWARGVGFAVAALAALFVVLLYPGMQTPRADSHLGGDKLDLASKVYVDPSTELPRLIAGLPPSEIQKLSNARAAYIAAEPVGERRVRSLVGARSAPVRVTTFTDSGCSHCATFHESLEQIAEVLPPATLAIDQRVFPLDNSCNDVVQRRGSEEVCLAARVRVCLERDPRALELTGWLHEDAEPLSTDSIYRVATRIASRSELEACVASKETADKLQEDIAFAMDFGIHGTPAILVNGKPAPVYMPFLYALALAAGDVDHAAFSSLPTPIAAAPGHEGHAH